MRTNHVELTFTIKRMTFGRRGSFEETTFHIRQSNTFDTKERERERERNREKSRLKYNLSKEVPVFLCAPVIV